MHTTLRVWCPVFGSTLSVSQEGNDGCSRLQAYFFDLFRMPGEARQSAATSKTLFLVNCGSAAVQLQKKQSQRLRLDPYVSHREGSIVVLLDANLRGPPDKYGLLTVRRPSLRCTPRSGSGVLCSSECFVSAKKATMAARGCRHIFLICLECQLKRGNPKPRRCLDVW